MMKMTGTLGGRKILALGLSFGNLDKFRAEPGDTYIRIKGEEMGLPMDVIIFSGETEDAMAEMMSRFIGPDTEIRWGKGT